MPAKTRSSKPVQQLGAAFRRHSTGPRWIVVAEAQGSRSERAAFGVKAVRGRALDRTPERQILFFRENEEKEGERDKGFVSWRH